MEAVTLLVTPDRDQQQVRNTLFFLLVSIHTDEPPLLQHNVGQCTGIVWGQRSPSNKSCPWLVLLIDSLKMAWIAGWRSLRHLCTNSLTYKNGGLLTFPWCTSAVGSTWQQGPPALLDGSKWSCEHMRELAMPLSITVCGGLFLARSVQWLEQLGSVTWLEERMEGRSWGGDEGGGGGGWMDDHQLISFQSVWVWL